MSSDAQLAADLARNPSQGLSGVYNAYSAKLYTYALTMLRDPATAQDVVHDSLLVAAGSIGQLRDPAKLRPWLYAITRNECLRAIRGRNRFSDTDEVIEVPDDSVDFYAGLRRDEASRIVAQGMAAMNPADRDILALALQHDLDVERLSQITGTKPNALHARLSRARTGLSDAISALVLHRARGKDCETLAGIIAPADQPLSPSFASGFCATFGTATSANDDAGAHWPPCARPWLLLSSWRRRRTCCPGFNTACIRGRRRRCPRQPAPSTPKASPGRWTAGVRRPGSSPPRRPSWRWYWWQPAWPSPPTAPRRRPAMPNPSQVLRPQGGALQFGQRVGGPDRRV